MNDMQPGQLIVPHAAPEGPQPTPPSQPHPQPAGEPTPERPTEVPMPTPPPMPAPEPEQMTAYSPVENEMPDSVNPEVQDIAWTAAEFVEHKKSAGWYGILLVVAVAIAALAYLFTHDIFSVATILVVLVGFGLFAARKPRTQDYLLSVRGIKVGAKIYNIHDYKAFSVSEEGEVVSVVLAPLKRFMPPLTLYVAPEVEERVFDLLSLVMPFEQHRVDAVDALMRRIRF